MDRVVEDESVRVARLLDAQAKAVVLFDEVVTRGVIKPGATERAASDAIRDLAADLFGVDRFWHKRIVRAGPNTLQPYRENPPDRVIGADDIVFCDFGPVFEQWEADFGRTFVLGGDEDKLRLRDDLTTIWLAGRAHFDANPEITGAQLYAHVVQLAEQAGWEFGGRHAGHLIGQFPHEKLIGEDERWYIGAGSDAPMRGLDINGQPLHWILEVHLVDRQRQFGGFVEELLDIGVPALG